MSWKIKFCGLGYGKIMEIHGCAQFANTYFPTSICHYKSEVLEKLWKF